jgi:tetratricopeptide (TPR) repeat protein
MANLHIISFIQGLSATEIRLVEEYLNKAQTLFDSKEHGIMELKLFKFLIHNRKESITDEMLSVHTGSKHISDLKNNLFQKVLEALIQDKYLINSDIFDLNDSVNFTLRKKLLVCKVSLRTTNSNKTETIQELLDDIVFKANEFELFDILVEALNTKKYFIGIRKGLKDFEAINEELKFAYYRYQCLISANDNYFKFILNGDFVKTLSKAEINNHLEASISQMQNDYKKTKSENINYFLHIMLFAHSEKKKDYEMAIKYCTKLLTIIKNSKAIFRNERVGFAHTNLSQYKTFLGRYSEALKDAKKSQQHYHEDSFNNAIAKELEFYINFYNEDYSAANKCLNALLSHSQIDTGQFRRSKYVYYRACVFFAEKEFKEALMLLNESLEIEKDKTRWNISLRILNIMIFIEMDKINEAFTSLEALRKYMERTGKTDEVSERDVLIVKLLRELEKDGFEMDPENKTTSKMLKQLSEKDSNTSWEYFSSELIPFHDWLGKKVKKK